MTDIAIQQHQVNKSLLKRLTQSPFKPLASEWVVWNNCIRNNRCSLEMLMILPCLRPSASPSQEIEYICTPRSQAINVIFCVFNQQPCEQAEESQVLNSQLLRCCYTVNADGCMYCLPPLLALCMITLLSSSNSIYVQTNGKEQLNIIWVILKGLPEYPSAKELPVVRCLVNF